MKNKIVFAYAITTNHKNGNLRILNHYLPIYWLKKIAKEEAKEYNCQVRKVKIEFI